MDRLTEEALRHLERALECEPSHIPSLLALSNAYLEQNDFGRVETLLSKALRKTKDQSEIYFLKAKLLWLQKEYVLAVIPIAKAIELDERMDIGTEQRRVAQSVLCRCRKHEVEHVFQER